MIAEVFADLVTIQDADALTVFTSAGTIPGAHAGLDPILANVRSRIESFQGDASTPAGRKQIASIAHAITRSKTYLEGIGKGLADDAKALPKKIDAGRRYANDTLDRWKDEIRKPLDEWESAEEARRTKHVNAIETIRSLGTAHAGWKAADYRIALTTAETVIVGQVECQEFEDGYRLAKKSTVAFLQGAIADAEKAEADAAELAKLRAERDAREFAERAAEAQRTESEKIASAATEAAEKAVREATEAAGRQSHQEREEFDRREAELRRRAEEAERREQQERARVAQEARDAEEAQRKREADKANIAKVRRTIATDLKDHAGLTEDQAVAVVRAIVIGKVPFLSIKY
jgi:hypothetical protein